MMNAQDSQKDHRPLELAVAVPAMLGSGYLAVQAGIMLIMALASRHPFSGESGPVLIFYGLVGGLAGMLTFFCALSVVRENRQGRLLLGLCLAFWFCLFMVLHRFGYGLLPGLAAVYLLARYAKQGL